MWGLTYQFIYFFTKNYKGDRKLNCQNKTKNALLLRNDDCYYFINSTVSFINFWQAFGNIGTLINI